MGTVTLSREQRKLVARLAQGGLSVEQIAAQLSVWPSVIRYALAAHTAAGADRCRSRKFTDEQVDTLVHRYTVDGVGCMKLATEFGVGHATILRTLQRRGVIARREWAKRPETRICRLCKAELPLKAFAKISTRPGAGGHGHGYECKPCLAGQNYERGYSLKNNTGITLAQYTELLAAQGGVCAICSKPPGKRRHDVDHDHTTDLIRGILCSGCNTKLSGLDDPVWVERARAYQQNPPAGDRRWVYSTKRLTQLRKRDAQ